MTRLRSGHNTNNLAHHPREQVARRVASTIETFHAGDMCRGTREHLALSEGEIYRRVLRALHATSRAGPVTVALSRDSRRAPEVASAALASLRSAEVDSPEH